MLAQAPRIGFLMDFPSRSALEGRNKLRADYATRAASCRSHRRAYIKTVIIRFGPSSLMANYSKIKRVVPSRRRLVVAVGGNRKVEEWEEYHRGRRKDWEAEKRSSKEIRWRERTQEQDGSRPPSLSTVCQDAQGPTIVRGRVTGVGLGVRERLVGVWEERCTIITALLELEIQSFSLSYFLCCLFAL